jgi:hypothetical protein
MQNLNTVLGMINGEQTNYPFRPVECTEEQMFGR